MKHTKTTFVFLHENGARLRELRKRKRLSLRDLALLMDRHQPGSFNLLAKLERGDLKYPSLGLVADFLRACGAGFRDLSDLLDGYTAQRPVLTEKGDKQVEELLKPLPGPEQRAMLKWERAVAATQEAKAAAEPAKRKHRVQTDRERVFRIVWSFIHANWNEVFEQRLYEALVRLGPVVRGMRRRDACRFGRRMFGVMTRYYASEERRKRALALVERRARDDGFSDEVVAALLQAAADAHSELQRSGRLDWKPTQDEIIKAAGRAPRVEKAETRLELGETRDETERNKALGIVKIMVKFAVNSRLERLRLEYKAKNLYLFWAERLVDIAVAHGTDSAEWRADVDATAPKLHDEQVAREMAREAAAAFEVWKAKLPAQPEPAPGR